MMPERPQTYNPVTDSATNSNAEQCLKCSQPLPNLRILVVDDNPLNRKYLRAGLPAEGYTVFGGENGSAALVE